MLQCQPLKTNVCPGGKGAENEGEIGGPDCKQGVGRQASFILTPLIRNVWALAEVIGFSWFVIRDGTGYMVKEVFIICKRASCFHPLWDHHLHAVPILITDLRCLLQQVPRGLMPWQHLFYWIELLHIHETMKICYLKVFDEVWLLVIHVSCVYPSHSSSPKKV